jgi:hypothetical protein
VKILALAVTAIILTSVPLAAQIIIVRDDRWAATSAESRALVNEQVEFVEWWLKRLRMPFQRVNASALTNNAGGLLCCLPTAPMPMFLPS